MGTPGSTWTWDSVPQRTFTPQEPLVEVLRVALESNVILIMLSEAEKAFLVQKLLWERSVDLRHQRSVAVLLLAKDEQVSPWTHFLKRTINLEIKEVSKEEEHLESFSGVILVATVDTFLQVILRNTAIPNIALCIIDNGHHFIGSPDISLILSRLDTCPAIRYVTITASILHHVDKDSFMKEALARLQQTFPGHFEASCELLSLLRYISQPRSCIVLFHLSPTQDEVQARIEDLVRPCETFLSDHQYSLSETYGDEFQDLIDEIPDPAEMPLQLLAHFLLVLRTFGAYSADRAALLLIIKIDKLKMKEKYERHFLLYSMLFTVLMKVRKLCDEAFSSLSETQKLETYSLPKLLKLMKLLLQYKPEHVAQGKNLIPKVAKSDSVDSISLEKDKEISTAKSLGPRKGFCRSRQPFSSYDDPNSLHSIIFVQNSFHAKVLYHFVKDLSHSDDKYSFLSPQYFVCAAKEGEANMDLEHRKQEEALRRFRMKECNVLISSSSLEVGIESVRCNLVISFDVPTSYKSYALQKVKAKAKNAWLIILCEKNELGKLKATLIKYQQIENQLKEICTFKDSPSGGVVLDDNIPQVMETFPPKDEQNNSATLKNAILYLNRYCAKLPSDTFTRLTPLFTVGYPGKQSFICSIQLPINSPLRSIISGPSMKTETLAKHAAALEALKRLHALKEIDDRMMSVGKDGPQKDLGATPMAETKDTRQGSIKRRQYYYKQVARHLTSCSTDTLHLYALSLNLSCPIPEEQNTRGRKIYPPENSAQSFGILVSEELPVTCTFPIYTRSGEVMVELTHLQANVALESAARQQVMTFHNYTFTQVLCLEKYPMVFNPEKSDNSVMVLPLIKGENGKVIDWDFLQEIASKHKETKLNPMSDEERSGFKFVESRYIDAVVMPWYRNQDQPQYFYVAEICSHLNPKSDFPAQGFESFEKYYKSKYNIQVQNLSQPLLDVDHTSARLNFLTPRYVNRKGIALPSSSEETKKNKRENLDQKQILVPELCAIHPFRASLWRQTVSLPCIFYRLNGLFIADQIRSLVSREMKIGLPTVPTGFTWEPLNFGWTLSDVLMNRDQQQIVSSPEIPSVPRQNMGKNQSCTIGTKVPTKSIKKSNKSDMEALSDHLINKMNEEDQKLKNKSLEIGTWSNEMAAQSTFESVDDDLEEEEFMFDPTIALPDNLTLLSNDIIPFGRDSGGRDWGTGIEQKTFRVGSPTFFDDSRANLPSLMDDLDGYSCSDSSGDDDVSEDDTGSVRIAFRGNNMAEAIEDETEVTKRVEVLAKTKEEEEQMLSSIPWQWDQVELEKGLSELSEGCCDSLVVIDLDQNFDKDQGNEITTIEEPVMDNECENQANELCTEMAQNLTILERSLPFQPEIGPSGLIFSPQVKFSFSFDHQPCLETHPGPSPSLILQAITMSNSNDAINLERLETIGDSFLKYAITAYLFSAHETIHEGRLSHLRSKQVSNFQLYNLGKKKALGECMIASKFEPHDNWLPPCYYVPKDLEQALIESGVPASHWNMAELPGIDQMNREEIYSIIRQKTMAIKEMYADEFTSVEDMPSFIPYNLLTQHSIPDKSIADCVEALIGAYLIACGQRGALLFMSWLGIRVLPNDEGGKPSGKLPMPPSPLLKGISNSKEQLEYLLHGYDSFEEIIGYRFKDRSYLLQAFTHASYFPNRLTDCYQRLEFLGDAILDYLITRYLYEDPCKHSPGALTDLRSALVNNTIFASMAVKYNFHKYFKHFSPGLQTVINRFVKTQTENDFKVSDEHYLVGEEEAEEAEDVEVPKALGDMFESVAGAIFLDSDLSLDTVWQVYYRMMKDEIELFSTNVPKSPIRELLELEPETAKFGKPEKLADGRRVRVTVEVFGKGVYKGIGRNYRIAKCTAAKCALRGLRKISMKNN